MPFAFRSLPHLCGGLRRRLGLRASPALLWLAWLLAWRVRCHAGGCRGFGFDELAAQARAEAGQPHQLPAATARRAGSAGLRRATATSASAPTARSGATTGCRSKRCSSISARQPAQPVRMHEITASGVRRIGLRRRRLRLRHEHCSTPSRWGDLGHAGFRIHYPLNTHAVQGRADRLPRRQLLPRARRRPAVRPVGARPGDRHRQAARREEFPRFTDFWLEQARRRARRTLTVYALLDSPRATGAYRFDDHARASRPSIEVQAQHLPARGRWHRSPRWASRR